MGTPDADDPVSRAIRTIGFEHTRLRAELTDLKTGIPMEVLREEAKRRGFTLVATDRIKDCYVQERGDTQMFPEGSIVSILQRKLAHRIALFLEHENAVTFTTSQVEGTSTVTVRGHLAVIVPRWPEVKRDPA